MKITKKWLKKEKACPEAVKWYDAQNTTDALELCRLGMAQGHFNWVNWALTRKMNKRQKVQYAVFAAELVIEIYENRHTDSRPREAIEAAKNYLKNPSSKTKTAVLAAADAAAYAADAAMAAADAAMAAAHAAADAAYAAADVAAYAAAHARTTAVRRQRDTLLKLINEA